MSELIDDEATWLCVIKADRILGTLPTEQIAHLGDDFPWAVTDEDVRVARTHLLGARMHAIELGLRLARLADEAGAAEARNALPHSA